MLYSDASAFFFAQVAFALSPGPVIIMLMVRIAGNDIYGALSYAVGAALGIATMIAAIACGFGSAVLELPGFYLASKIALVAYFAWLAWSMWGKGIAFQAANGSAKSGILTSLLVGLGICLVSPNVIIFNTVLVPEVMGAKLISWDMFAVLIATGFAAWIISYGTIVGCASRIVRVLSDPAKSLAAGRMLASVLVVAGGWIVTG